MNQLPDGRVPVCEECLTFGDALEFRGTNEHKISYSNWGMRRMVSFCFWCNICKRSFKIQANDGHKLAAG